MSGVQESLLRATNFAVALTALVLLAPLMLAIAALIKLDSPGPVIYRQLRVGLDRRSGKEERERTSNRVMDLGGRPFTLYKFRTMRKHAELQSGPVWARRDDPRTTRVGRVLRRTRLDELPQMWNVLAGDMAIVGPRPERPHHILTLRDEIDDYPLRHAVKPGITGWAQVHQGADRSMEDVRAKIDYDLQYIRQRSLWLDLRIMARTVPVLLRGEEFDCDEPSSTEMKERSTPAFEVVPRNSDSRGSDAPKLDRM